MNEKQMSDEIMRYISDRTYNYALLIDGEWGSGKTYYVKNVLVNTIKNKSNGKTAKYFSVYGKESISKLKGSIIISSIKDKLPDKFENSKAIKHMWKSLYIFKSIVTDALKDKVGVDLKTIGMSDLFDIKPPVENTVLIFDDIERSAIPLNELFGFFNELVEQYEVKIILIANEKEVKTFYGEKTYDGKALQYLVAANQDIKIPLNTVWGNSKADPSLVVGELERRRGELFPAEENNNEYQRVKEKLIGITLKYVPNVKNICEKMIDAKIDNNDLRKVLIQEIDYFATTMINKKHCNFRTFQFFLSTVKYVYSVYVKIEKEYNLDQKEQARMLSFLSRICFDKSVDYKSKIEMPSDKYDETLYDITFKMPSIEALIKEGFIDQKDFSLDIHEYIQTEIKAKIDKSDPFFRLQDSYFLMSQIDVEECIKEIKNNLNQNKYPEGYYSRIILIVYRLVDMGLNNSYLQEIHKLMILNAERYSLAEPLTYEYLEIQDKKMYDDCCELLKPINEIIEKNKGLQKQTTISNLLSTSKIWATELNEMFMNADFQSIQTILGNCSEGDWNLVIQKSTADQLYKFYHFIKRIYIDRAFRSEKDYEIMDSIQTVLISSIEEEKDVIKKYWKKSLLELIKRVIAMKESK